MDTVKVYPPTPKIGANMLRQWQAEEVYTVEVLVNRWRRLSEQDKATSRMWYPLMNRWDRAVALSYSRPVGMVHGLNAVLSQSTELDLNLDLVLDYLEGKQGHRRSQFAHDKAKRLLAGEDPATVVSGPKITRYYRSIVSSGEDLCAVCDRHEVRAPFVGDWRDYITPAHALSDTGYPIVEEMHITAAVIVGEKPGACQPGWWKDVRGQFASMKTLKRIAA